MSIRLCPRGQEIQQAGAAELDAARNYVSRHAADPTREQQVNYYSGMIPGIKRTTIRKLHAHVGPCKLCRV